MAQKIIKGPVDDNSLNSTNHNFTELYNGFRDTSGKINKVEEDINDRMDNFIEETSDAAFDKVVDSARLDWDTMVEKYSELPRDAKKGATIGVKEDGLVYRYDGSKWVKIYEINLNPISEVDERLSSQLAETEQQMMVTARRNNAALRSWSEGEGFRPIVSFIDDDSIQKSFNKLKDTFRDEGVAFGIASAPNYTEKGPQMTGKDIQEALDMGCEFLSHTLNHRRISGMSEEELEYELVESRRVLERKGLDIESFVYPYSEKNDVMMKLVQKHYSYAFISSPTLTDYPVPTYQIQRVPLGSWTHDSGNTLEDYKSYVDEAIETNGWLVFVTHAWDPDHDEQQQQYLKETIRYIKSKGVEIVLPSEGYNERGNMLQVGTGKYTNDDKRVITRVGDIIGSRERLENTSLGLNAKTKGVSSSAVGRDAFSEGSQSIAMGVQSHSGGRGSIASGYNARTKGELGIAIGRNAETGEERRALAIGENAKAEGENASAYGQNASVSENHGVAVGSLAKSNGISSISLGSMAKSEGPGSIAIGYESESDESQAIAIGGKAKAMGKDSVAIGRVASALNDNEFVLGNSNHKVILPSDTITMKSTNGNYYDLYVNSSGELRVRESNVR